MSQSLRLISATVRSGHYKQLFGSNDTISGLVQGVVVPNVVLRGASQSFFHSQHPFCSSAIISSDHEVEQFEDDPLEYIRIDLSIQGTGDTSTRRQAAADLLRAPPPAQAQASPSARAAGKQPQRDRRRKGKRAARSRSKGPSGRLAYDDDSGSGSGSSDSDGTQIAGDGGGGGQGRACGGGRRGVLGSGVRGQRPGGGWL